MASYHQFRKTLKTFICSKNFADFKVSMQIFASMKEKYRPDIALFFNYITKS